MAFRSFYQSLFPHSQQKEASIYLTVLWKRDPFKAKWTIVAAAYSKIRDTVGKPRAPLDRFLSVVCPRIGIIGVHAYLSALNWTCDSAAEGSLVFHQSATPDLQALDQHILYSNMTEKDVINFCGSAGYIPRAVARRIAAAYPPSSHQSPHYGLFSSAPVVPQPIDTPSVVADTPEVSAEAGTLIFMPPLTQSTMSTMDYGWTGSMSDLYHPSEGSIDFDQLLNNTYTNAWDTVNIHDPQSLDTLIDNGEILDGFLAPYVPDI